ncbi:sigma-70 family RNA polymerase sigma factor [Peteryoungia desertarenae]|uniref:Sigma-70 family RNA polymerase sigma factor n=1 Tax=Peteryoungia desertarenae TaxID=1813451 RepID=A0ABX6QRL9_9HYPH|nr:sigma-70 family RNA polymerase sigma factor [Peteryoungia desertarenae]QLF71306.1 sigma-70 family RNA polymerase sigma factor [Peteryoungia desertarenae]
MDAQSIAHLLARVTLRDRTAFAAIYAGCAPKLFAVCLRILKDRQEAEEALQDVFVKIWQKAENFSGDGQSAMGWMTAIARYHCIDRLRARRQMGEDLDVASELPDLAPDPEQTAMIRSEGARIDTCLEELDPERAQAVRHAYVEGLSYQELADRFAVPLNTMRTWLRRSLLKLRECMDGHTRPEQG